MFDAEQTKAIAEIVHKSLGLEEGKTLSEVVGGIVKDTTNSILNGYDKKQKAELASRDASLSGIKELVEGLGKKLEETTQAPPTGDDGKPDLSKLPAPVREMLELQKSQAEKLAKQVEQLGKERELEKQAREVSEKKAADQALRAALRANAAEAGLDPKALDDVVAVLHDAGKKVRARESGDGYEFQHGTEDITGEPKWVPLADGLKQWAGTDNGKRYAPPVQGGSPTNPPGAIKSADGSKNLTDADVRALIGQNGDISKLLEIGEVSVTS